MEQLRRLRKAKGLSQARLAARAELDPSTVNQIERGARDASPATLRKLADALDVGLIELLEDASPKAHRRSLPEPSFNDVLEDERRPAHDVAVDAARRQAVEDRQATARLIESEQPQPYFMNPENDVVMRLLQYPPDELAGALVELARHCVYLETLLEHRSEATPEKAATRDAPA